MLELLYGRELLNTELPKNFPITQSEILTKPAHVMKAGQVHCVRCQSVMEAVASSACICGEPCAYCRNCLQMGKVRKCSTLYSLPEPNLFQREKRDLLVWEGTLSTQQREGSNRLIESVNRKETHLLWAVAGAGKTEMLFEGIAHALRQKKRVCVASPRVDVCLELAPRFKAAFPYTPTSVLYGGMEEPYAYTQLVIATTHQLYRFKEAFDVLIIDEIDAFPFHLDDSLQFAADKARKQASTFIYLSATPSPQMQKDVRKKKLSATILPARYHGHPLPVPKPKMCFDWQIKVLKKIKKTSFGKALDQRIQKNKKCLVFVPNIEWMLKLEKQLRNVYPEVSFAAVSSEDPLRKEKVLKMRENTYQFLLTTTILERGVTFPNVDVLVLGAEDRIFTEAALVQIAGRAGRSPKYPTGDVLFFHSGQSIPLKKAIKQIKQMNRLAKKRGLIA